MLTYIVDPMPPSFWEYIYKMGLQDVFISQCDNLVAEVDILIIRTKTIANRDFISHFPNLRLIIRAGTGYDNVDLVAARERGIAVATTPDANTQSAYEQTMMFILALIKQIGTAAKSLNSGSWKEMLKPSLEISDLRVLIVGLGRIGKLVNRSLQFLGAEVKGVDPYVDKQDWLDNNISAIDYSNGLQWCNLVTFHCPLTTETYHYFSLKHLSQLSNPIYIVNAARGGILEETAVQQGIKSGLILGAAMDVFEVEPGRAKLFKDYQEVIVSPHIGSHTEKAKLRLAEETWKTWYAFYENGVLRNEVDYSFAFSLKKI